MRNILGRREYIDCEKNIFFSFLNMSDACQDYEEKYKPIYSRMLLPTGLL